MRKPKPGTAPAAAAMLETNLRVLRAADCAPWPGLNPRRRFDPAKLAELTESVRKRGVRQPILVHIRPYADVLKEQPPGVTYWIVAGERRWRAATAVGPDTPIPCMAKVYTEEEALEIALVENLDRDDLSAIEEARGFQSLIDVGWTQDRIADRFGCSQEVISNRVRLLQLPDQVLELIEEGLLPASHARDLLLPFVGIPEAQRKQLYAAVIRAARDTAKEHGRVAIRESEVFDVVQRTARALSKPVGSKDGVTPLFDPKQHTAECTCRAPRFRYMTYGPATQRCFDPQWWDRAQAAARRRRQKARDAQRAGEQKAVATASASGGALKYAEFTRKHGGGRHSAPLGKTVVDVAQLEGARFVVVDDYPGMKKKRAVICLDHAKVTAAHEAVEKEVRALVQTMQSERERKDGAEADAMPLEPWMAAEFIRAQLNPKMLLDDFGIAAEWHNSAGVLQKLPDEQLARMCKIVALRVRRGDYTSRTTVQDRARTEVERKYRPGILQLRKRVLSDGKPGSNGKSSSNGKPSQREKAGGRRRQPAGAGV